MMTMHAIRDAMAKLEGLGPMPPAEIRVGSMLNFREAMKDRLHPIEGDGAALTYGGVPVRVHPSVPPHMAVLIRNGRVDGIIVLSEPESEGA